LKENAGDAARSRLEVMTRRTHLALFAVLIALGCVPVSGATHGSVGGVVRDSGGVPQIGAEVQLLRPDLSVIASVYTDAKGHFRFSSIFPGRYALKAMGASYLPSMRENIRVRSTTIVNLTLNTLYEVMQWLPAQPRTANTQNDDWAWTLRSAANRPLLRWLEDGPLVVVREGPGAPPKLKARLMATGQAGTFGESGERYSAMVEATPSNSRELLARVDFDPRTDAGMESMLGFRQDLGMAGSVQSVAAFAVHPEIAGPGAEGVAAGGLSEGGVRTWETINLGDAIEAEVGSNQVLARFERNSPNTVMAALPFATVGWRSGDSTVRYGMTTVLPGPPGMDQTRSQAWLPRVSSRNGRVAIEHGLHQEIGWERRTDASGMAVLVFADNVDDPVLEAMGKLAGGDSGPEAAMFDGASGLLRAAGPSFSTAGVLASYERRLPGGNQIRLTYANGNALVMSGAVPDTEARPVSTAEVIAAAHPRHTQMYALALSGVIEGTGTRWRASYRWQPDDTVTAVAPFAKDAAEPYLNLHIRQALHVGHDGYRGFEAIFDLGNLLAEGYQPYVLSDGSVVVFAQDRRSISAGVAFTF